MSTTQILFNSPALHSLKRDQLVKLCKLHSIKANGKNVELIERLKQYALQLPPEALAAEGSAEELALEVDAPDPIVPASSHEDVTREDNDVSMEDAHTIPGGFGDEYEPPQPVSAPAEDYNMQDVVLTSRFSVPRPSEQWEVVMEDIEEVDESRNGTMSSKSSLRTISNGEFGTHSSKTSVTSSLKALATSLGIKRATAKFINDSQPHDVESEGNNMPGFSPGKLFGSTKARDSLAAHATPYSNIPPSESLPETDFFKFATPDASFLEDDALAADDTVGGPSPAKSSIRLGTNPAAAMKSTIRLVSQSSTSRADQAAAFMSPPRLPVVKTDFDLMVGTPGTIRTLNMWPASPRSTLQDPTERLYPKLPLDDHMDDAMPGGMFAPTATPAKTPAKAAVSSTTKSLATPGPVDEPDMFSPAKPTAMTTKAGATPGPSGSREAIPRSQPFLFGSPLPPRPSKSSTKPNDKEDTIGVSDSAFDGVARSVLEEMHRRLAEQNAAKGDGAAKTPILPTQPLFAFGAAATTAPAAPPPALDRFAKAHDAEFSKMDSIATHYAARRAVKRKSEARGSAVGVGALGRGRPSAGQRRRSSAANARVISAGSRKRMAVPGGFGGDDDEDEDGEEAGEGVGVGARGGDGSEEEDPGDRRASKRVKITQGWDVHRAGARVSLAPPLPPAEEQKKAKEREAVKRELDAAKARRRSSRGRPSMGAPPAKSKSRFGFLSSAKSMVRNVWNMGGGSKPKAAAVNAPPSSIPVPRQAPPVPPAKSKSDTAAKASDTAANALKASGSQPRPPSMSSTSSKLLKPSASGSTADAKTGTITSTKSANARSRSPIPPFTAPSGIVTSTTSVASRPESLAGTARSRVSSATRTATVSSMGTRTGLTSATSPASSMGTRKSVASSNTLGSTGLKSPPEVKGQDSVRKRTSSLLAPTASSLAKTASPIHRPSNAGRTSGLPVVAEASSSKPKRMSAAQAAASTLKTASNPMSPRPTRIFSQPLTNLTMSSPASSVAGGPSLGAAAAMIMADSSPSKIPRPTVLPPKPKQLVARKPRISRSRVIAKLGAQRAAAAQGTGTAAALTSPVSASGGARTRSSMGDRARNSLGGVKAGRASAGADLRTAAKKRARQSEYLRRRSRAGGENEALAA